MAQNEINDLTPKTTPLSTDEVELQATGGGASAKATLANLAKGMDNSNIANGAGYTTNTGDVTASSSFGTDNRIIRSDGTGKGVQASEVTLDDINNLSLVPSVPAPGSGTLAALEVHSDVIEERTAASGVTIDGVLIKDGEVDGVDVSALEASLSTVATTGSYDNLSDKPTIPTASDTAYNASSWNGNTDVPTKNAVRDKIVSMDSAISANTAKVSATTANVNSAGAVMNTDTTTASMDFVVDEDDMSSNSATKLATQQSIKAYVDALAGLGGIHSQSTSSSNGYIRFVSGIQIAWRVESYTANVSSSYGSLYYGDRSLGDWGAAFDAILTVTASTNLLQHWVAQSSYTTTNAGSIRIYRPVSNSSVAVTVYVVAIGTWS